MLCILVFRKFDTKNVQMNFLPKIKNGLPKRHASKAHISSDFQDLGCEKFFYQYGDLHFIDGNFFPALKIVGNDF